MFSSWVEAKQLFRALISSVEESIQRVLFGCFSERRNPKFDNKQNHAECEYISGPPLKPRLMVELYFWGFIANCAFVTFY